MIFVVTFMGALLQYKHHFATTAYSTALLNIGMIASLLITEHLDQYTITYYLSYGVLAGGFMQIIVHLYAVKKQIFLKYFILKNINQKVKIDFTKLLFSNFGFFNNSYFCIY